MTTHDRTPDRVLHLSAYVDLSLGDVVDALAGPRIGALLQPAMRAALGPAGEDVVVRASDVERLSVRSARVVVTWRTTGPTGDGSTRSAPISLLVVQSGHQPVTELLVALPVADEAAGPAAAAVRRFLDELGRRLSLVAA